MRPQKELCELLNVSRSGYCDWVRRQPSAREQTDALLKKKIASVHAKSRNNYGAPRVMKQLRSEGVHISKRRCARLMKADGLQGKKKHRRAVRTTNSEHGYRPAPNLVPRGTNATAPDQIWVTDITYLNTAEGWVYLAAIMDLWSRKIVGWACSPTLHVSLVLTALARAKQNRRPKPGLIHHSDRGVQYACDQYAQALRDAHISPSMSRKANCYDNATMEAFWSTLKTETGLDVITPFSRRAATTIVFDYIETFYNRTRLHSSLGFLSPVAYEIQSKKTKTAA